MVTANLSRGSTSVDFELWEEGGNLALARDVGKPDLRFYEIGGDDPRFADTWSTLEVFTATGQLVGSDAYLNAKRLAEGLVKPHHGSDETELDLSGVSGFGSYNVGFPDSRALTLFYEPGQRNWVSLQLQAVHVNDTQGDRSGSTAPTVTRTQGSGNKRISLTDPEGNSFVLHDDLVVERRVGRPNTTIRHTFRELPSWVDRFRASSDTFIIGGVLAGATSRSDGVGLMEDVLRPARGYNPLTLDFDGLYGLGSYSVVPAGSRAARVSVRAGEATDLTWVDTLELRVVKSTFDPDELGGE